MEYSKTTVLVRHIPSELSDDDKLDLLRHFGAKSARPMGTKGPMKHAAFAKFETAQGAEICIRRLHQLEVLGRKLVVEYAKSDQEKHFPNDDDITKPKEKEVEKPDKQSKTLEIPKFEKPGEESYKKHGITYPRKPTLFYLYPPPTVSTLTNIANALASHPKFYTQVLHLMNKMNLPCPFGTVTASPPLALESRNMDGRKAYGGGLNDAVAGDINEIEMEQESSEESEIESDNETRKRKGGTEEPDNVPQKRSVKRQRRTMKLVQPDLSNIVKPAVIATPGEVFETVEEMKSKQITLNISATPNIEQSSEKAVNISEQRNKPTNIVAESVTVIEGGFGKVEPHKAKKVEETQKSDVNYTIDQGQFLPKDKVASGRLKESQFKDFSVFKNYSPGECTSRLYIKNLTKHTQEQELVNLFGVFIDWSVPLAKDTFDIRLMKEGRMKGQAFVTLPDEDSAQAIVKGCNGYILNNKPMVIQFARSAKAKEVDKPLAE